MKTGRRLTIGLAALAAVPLLYVLSFGPACWLTAQTIVGGEVVPARGMWFYWPLGMVASDMDSVSGRSARWWITLGVRKGQSAVVPISTSGNAMILDAD
jgi:hypothetical protein